MADLNRGAVTVQGHFHSAWSIDHPQADALEAWTAITYLAPLHPQLQWGHTVLNQAFRSPALVAKMGATLQYMSGGRFILGIGAGGQELEHLAYGYSFPRGRKRVAALDEALQIVKAMWTEETTTFSGADHRADVARCDPKLQPPPPVMVGAFLPQMLRLAARHADWWNVSSTGLAGYRRLAHSLIMPVPKRGATPQQSAAPGPAAVFVGRTLLLLQIWRQHGWSWDRSGPTIRLKTSSAPPHSSSSRCSPSSN